MSKYLCLIILCLNFFYCFSQNPVQVTYSLKKINSSTAEVVIKMVIEKGWHVYSQIQPADAIALPTKIEFSKNPIITFEGDVKETGKKEVVYLKDIEVHQAQYSDEVDFSQLIRLKAKAKTKLVGSITYQACTDTECLKEKTIQFNVTL